MSEEEERLGADLVEHCVSRANTDSHLVFSGQHANHKPPTISNLVTSLNGWAQPSSKEVRRGSNAIENGGGRANNHDGTGVMDLENHDDVDSHMNGGHIHNGDGYNNTDDARKSINTDAGYVNNGFRRESATRSTNGDIRRGPATVVRPTDSRASSASRGVRNNTNRLLLDGGALHALPRARIGNSVANSSGRNSRQDDLAKFADIAQVYPA
ncbi:hypothetical protein PoB_002909900 [Plakobranchus ocellatus]|uniref:Uncharacterized protein n=1 Tax=Plakobranchus ocellatus TaxID=259542 RepID=A0AAV4A8P5_9GAST|nr:hypothetical protein PoB_002909900 [Plakobranchus ocellatus]